MLQEIKLYSQFCRGNDGVSGVVLPTGAHGARATAGRCTRRSIRVTTPRRQLRGLHRGQVLRAHLQRVLPVSKTVNSLPSYS